MAKFIIDIDENVSKSMVEMILENELDCKVYVKVIEQVDEDKLDELASKCTPKTWAENAYDDDFIYGFKAGYRKAMEV